MAKKTREELEAIYLESLTMVDLFTKLEEDGYFVESIYQRPLPASDQWQVNLRKKNENGFGYYPGSGPTLRDALHQAAGNGGAISGRKSMIADDKPQRHGGKTGWKQTARSAKDLLG